MTCESCAKAEADPRSGEFMLRCNECQTRMVADLLIAYESALAKITREGETPKDAHARVVAWAERIKA